MKTYLAAVTLAIIAFGLFIGFMGSTDMTYFGHTLGGVAPWIVVCYIVASSGLTQYRRIQDVRGHIGYVALLLCMLIFVGVNRFCGRELVSVKLGGIAFFALALADISLGFLIPVRWLGGANWGRKDDLK